MAVVYNMSVKPEEIGLKRQDMEGPDILGMFTAIKANSMLLSVESSRLTDLRHYGRANQRK